MTDTLSAATVPRMADDTRRRAELLADIAASAIPHHGRLRGIPEFREADALSRPSILRRAAAALAAEVPREADRLVAVGRQAVVLTTALSLHTGLPLSLLSGPDGAGTQDDGREGVGPGQNVVLVAASAADDTQIADCVTALERSDVRVLTTVSLLCAATSPTAVRDPVPRVPRAALMTEEELALSTVGDRT